MKDRPKGFLAEPNISHDSEAFDYIRELHDYLWRFVGVVFPGKSGSLHNYVDAALAKLEAGKLPE